MSLQCLNQISWAPLLRSNPAPACCSTPTPTLHPAGAFRGRASVGASTATLGHLVRARKWGGKAHGHAVELGTPPLSLVFPFWVLCVHTLQ